MGLIDDEGNIVDKDDIVYEEEKYTDENGNEETRNVPKIKEESLLKMKEKEQDDKDQFQNKPPKRMVVKEVEEIDELGDIKKVLKEIEKDGVKKAPETTNLKEETILDKFDNIKNVLIDEEEVYTDENGNDKIKNIPKIREKSLLKMKEKEQ